ncbi:MAG: DUF3131 domain-containing protein [Alphaproteobacteria bacterium]|nr:DUF3131 domain-containing protein [Alphaproteobacteria bacterium]
MRAFALSHRYQKTRAAIDDPATLAQLAMAQEPAAISPQAHRHGQTAWAFFNRFTDHQTGFAPASDFQVGLAPWEMGATLLAITSADRLGLITSSAATTRISQCLESLAKLPLCQNGLPARLYCTKTLRPLDPDGWSAGSILRLVAGFIITAHRYPTLAPEISIIMNHWQLDRLVEKGRFWSGTCKAGKTNMFGDCFLGYEQYAARAACLINLQAEPALDPRPILRAQDYLGHALPGDKRLSGAIKPVITSEPFTLEAMEFGWRQDMLELAVTLYLAQKARFKDTGTLTCLSEDALDTAPGFAFHAILAGQTPFASRACDGADISHLRCLSTKAAFAWWALLPTPYSQKLLDAISDLGTPTGWQTGIYEASGRPNRALSLNTNAAVLEALHYKAFGPLFGGVK